MLNVRTVHVPLNHTVRYGHNILSFKIELKIPVISSEFCKLHKRRVYYITISVQLSVWQVVYYSYLKGQITTLKGKKKKIKLSGNAYIKLISYFRELRVHTNNEVCYVNSVTKNSRCSF